MDKACLQSLPHGAAKQKQNDYERIIERSYLIRGYLFERIQSRSEALA
jgi:hypothetical protein